jgi:UDP-N-acetylglucosamine 1-carboxyvinyltransferase
MKKEQQIFCVSPSVLKGTVRVSGAKNSVLRLMAASLLTDKPVVLRNYPDGLLDVQVHEGMLTALGKSVDRTGSAGVRILESSPIQSVLKWTERSIRNTLLILGALTARLGEGRVPLPGGCKLGERKYDLHVMLLEKLGATVWEEGDLLCARAPNGLKGTDIHLPIRSTGATENSIICGTLAKGVTRVWNPHIRPEIIDLIKFLRSMGAKIEVYGQERIEIEGVEALSGTDHEILPDNMEALTWLIASVITGGDVEIQNFPVQDLEVPLIFLRESGARFYQCGTDMIVQGGCCYPVEISTGPYPGINSDMQPLFAVYGACSRGESRIVDLRFPGRYGYAEELAKMGLRYEVKENLLRIHGGNKLHGTPVRALDLRAGIALLLAGLVAEGETVIADAWQIERGYDRLLEKLRILGGKVCPA